MFKRVCVIGVGLIGGSFAKAARIHHLAQSIVGFGRVDDLENLLTEVIHAQQYYSGEIQE